MELKGLELEAASHLCHWHGQAGGFEGGSFAKALIRALEAADRMNLARLLNAFPEYRPAIEILQSEGASKLADVVADSWITFRREMNS